ncbi:MAG: short-chain dehydrogenase/reductase [Proteobacteria bacterium]|nr:short-chain dehydrogenase/reductase [Pseudomonadota bacterium]
MPIASLSGKTVLVTGAGGGIGRALANAFAREKATLLLIGRKEQDLEATAAPIRDHGGKIHVFPADVTDEAALLAVMAEVGRLDVAVNAAGIIASGAIDEMGAETFSRVLSVNVLGLWLSMKHEIQAMKRNGGGAIINIGSNIGARLVRPTLGAYAASKAAVSSLTRTAALEAISHGIRINCLCPGPVDTPMSLRPGEDRERRDARIAATNPSRRVAQPDEIAQTALWLASGAADFIVGQDIVVDGGASA